MFTFIFKRQKHFQTNSSRGFQHKSGHKKRSTSPSRLCDINYVIIIKFPVHSLRRQWLFTSLLYNINLMFSGIPARELALVVTTGAVTHFIPRAHAATFVSHIQRKDKMERGFGRTYFLCWMDQEGKKRERKGKFQILCEACVATLWPSSIHTVC